jgi:phosphopantothenoylcysteine decarboxylase/phosphopantothenate--cysteine ligase
VSLVSGPVQLRAPGGVELVAVETALEMRDAVMNRVGQSDIFIGVAAVADYRPQQIASQKIKKQAHRMQIELVRNPDILAEVAALEQPPFSVGFAAETERVEQFAEAKRQAKGIDMIAANQVGEGEGGFEADENALTLLWQGGKAHLPMMDKSQLASLLAEQIARQYQARLEPNRASPA